LRRRASSSRSAVRLEGQQNRLRMVGLNPNDTKVHRKHLFAASTDGTARQAEKRGDTRTGFAGVVHRRTDVARMPVQCGSISRVRCRWWPSRCSSR
jgi:hypothetical protein